MILAILVSSTKLLRTSNEHLSNKVIVGQYKNWEQAYIASTGSVLKISTRL